MSMPRKLIPDLPHYQVVLQIADERLTHRALNAAGCHADVMPVAFVTDLLELVLQVGNPADTGAAEEIVGDLVLRALAFAKIERQLAVPRLAARERHRRRRDASDVRSPAAPGAERLCEHWVVNHF